MLPMLGHDKANHYVYGSAFTAVGAFHSPLAGLLLCAVAAVGKEVYDRTTRRGTPDLMDTVWTLAGAVPVLLPLAAAQFGWALP